MTVSDVYVQFYAYAPETGVAFHGFSFAAKRLNFNL